MGHMIENKIELVTKVGEFAGKPFLAIHEIKNGEESVKPIVSFGLKKAKAILASIKEIVEFVDNE